MNHLETRVLVIGGGSTGAGVVWDLALRGVPAVLVERGDLAAGATGRSHGLLHSGARYAVNDPDSAAECWAENRILRRIAGACIEDSGGYVVETPWDDATYASKLVEGCRVAGIPCEEVTVGDALHAEPLLHPAIRRAFTVPDAAVDAAGTVRACARSAHDLGAGILTGHAVTGLIRERDRVGGAVVRSGSGDEMEVRAEVTVNAAGAWAGRVAAMAGCEVTVVAGKGILIAFRHRLLDAVVNRCRLPADGDIIVPSGTSSVLGTTDIASPDPDDLEVVPDETARMLAEGERLVPGLRQAPVLKVWAGVRPLFREGPAGTAGDREVSRSHRLLDHREHDGVAGFVTIVGGKFTTFRKMAEVTADLVCEHLGVYRRCTTATEQLPSLEA